MGSLPQDPIGTRESLEVSVKEAHEKYTKTNPVSLSSYQEACKYLPGGNTRTILHTTPFPLAIASGQGCKLTTVDGHEYVDFLGEYTAGIYGHSHPVIRKAIDEALDHGWNLGGQHPNERTLAKMVVERFPAIDKVRFVNSGTEANMMAIATAVAFTGKKKILLFRKGYHGGTISGAAYQGDVAPKMSVNLPHEFVVAPYNDVADTKAVVESLPADSLAAILVEPMMGSGGCFAGTPEFLGSLRELATAHGALLIIDEVMTSRLAYHGYTSTLLDGKLAPDLMTLAKWVGGGMSFGAFGGRAAIMNLYDPRSGQLEHPGTFNNNVLSMAAGIAGCNLLTPFVLDTLNALGDRLRHQLHSLFADEFAISGSTRDIPIAPLTETTRTPTVFVVGVGSLMNIHFSGPNKDLLHALFYHHMLAHGIYMAPRGFTALSLGIDEQDVDRFVRVARGFCRAWQVYLK